MKSMQIPSKFTEVVFMPTQGLLETLSQMWRSIHEWKDSFSNELINNKVISKVQRS